MKTLCNDDGTEDLTQFTYIYRRDVFRRKRLYYKFITSCEVCGESFFMRLNYPTGVCSTKCTNKSETTRLKISKALMGRKKTKCECEMISKRKSKGDVVKLNIPLYNTFAHQISLVEEVFNDNGVLKVRCSVCGEWFMAKRTSVEGRSQYIKGNIDREYRFYCSEYCKTSCTIFNKHKYRKGMNIRKSRNNKYFSDSELRVWAKQVLSIHNYVCEYCGKKATTAHHIEPKKLQPFYALDPANGVACCSDCHYNYGHKDECSTINISKVTCQGI